MTIGGNSFGTARAARELLRQRAEQIIKNYMEMAALAVAAGDYESAQKAYSDLAKHIPKDDDGSTAFDPDIDRKVIAESKHGGPAIQIGVAIGGLNRALPEPTIEIVEITKTDGT